jgi:hypothetical protein
MLALNGSELEPLLKMSRTVAPIAQAPFPNTCGSFYEIVSKHVSAWLRNSVNPIEGNAKKSEYYWKEVVDLYN